MPNGGINYELDFERHIREMPDRQLLEFVARQTFDQGLQLKAVCADTKLTRTRSIINRWILIILIIVLITLGVIDPTLIKLI